MIALNPDENLSCASILFTVVVVHSRALGCVFLQAWGGCAGGDGTDADIPKHITKSGAFAKLQTSLVLCLRIAF